MNITDDEKLYNHDIEKKLIGAILLDGDEYFKVSGELEAADFHYRPYQELWEGFRRIVATGNELNIDTVQSVMSEKSGDWLGITFDAVTNTQTSSGALVHAKKIKNLAIRRKINNLLSFVASKNYDLEFPTTQTIKGMMNTLSDISSSNTNNGIRSSVAMIDFLASLSDESAELEANSPAMAKVISGYDPDTLIILSGRPGMGKTAFEVWDACNFARKGKKVHLHSLEMSAMQIWQRHLCGMAGVSYHKVKELKKSGGLPDDTMKRFTDAVNKLAERYKDNLVIFDKSGQTTEEIYITTMREKPDIVYIDHLGLLGDDRPGWSKNDKTGHVSWQGKRIAKDFHIPVVMLSQLNREVEKRQDKHPSLSDLRDSGEVEQNADIVIGVYRDDYYTGIETDTSIVDFQVLKNRNGRIGKWQMMLNMPQQWFFEINTN